MKGRFIRLTDDIIILEIKTDDSFEYYIRSDCYPFEHVFGVAERFTKNSLLNLLNNGYFDLWLEEQ